MLQLQTRYNSEIVDVRARGLMIAIELKTIESANYIYNRLLERGFLVGFKEKTIRFMPPLTIEQKDIDKLIITLAEIIKELK